LAYGGILLMAIVALDSVLVNFFEIEIYDALIWNDVGNASYFNRALWTSTAAPTEEPGITALFLNLLAPFPFLYFKKKRIFLGALYFYCLISTFSSTGLLTALLGSAIVFIWLSKQKKMIAVALAFTLVLSAAIFFRNEITLVLNSMAFIEKITFSGETVSDSDRSDSYRVVIKDALSSPLIGTGPGHGSATQPNGYLSTFGIILAEYGFPAFFLFCLFWLSIWHKCFALPRKVKPYFVYSLISISLAALIGANLHNLGFWLLPPIITKCYNRRAECAALA
jgi:hypothetical protein